MPLKIITALGLFAAFCSALASPASAQATATPAASAAVKPENPAVTTAAKTFYSELLVGKVDRSKMSAELNTALPDSTLQTLSQQLTALGPPTWQYFQQISGANGSASVYKLTYATTALYLTFGISDAGTIYAVFLGNQPPGSK
jgi:hypothetical protein